mmetsp:Transcript_4786/g.20321  ORF Transcript_4786/g.20321 Transcript_4786/m.20321 type:complete len:266 (+) Transcript_4786:2844-3641(+)
MRVGGCRKAKASFRRSAFKREGGDESARRVSGFERVARFVRRRGLRSRRVQRQPGERRRARAVRRVPRVPRAHAPGGPRAGARGDEEDEGCRRGTARPAAPQVPAGFGGARRAQGARRRARGAAARGRGGRARSCALGRRRPLLPRDGPALRPERVHARRGVRRRRNQRRAASVVRVHRERGPRDGSAPPRARRSQFRHQFRRRRSERERRRRKRQRARQEAQGEFVQGAGPRRGELVRAEEAQGGGGGGERRRRAAVRGVRARA